MFTNLITNNGTLTLAIAVVFLCISCVKAHDDQRYDFQEKIPLFLDNLIPEDNPSESYTYLQLAYCTPPELKYKTQTLGEVLQGSRKVYSSYELRFGVEIPHFVLCEKVLTESEIKEFLHAVQHRYHYTMYYDEIPLRGYVGETVVNKAGTAEYYLYTTLHFKISYNRDRVIEAQIFPDADSKVRLDPQATSLKVTYAYTAKWTETDIDFFDRPANKGAELFAEDINIQWVSIINSVCLAVLVAFFLVFLVMRVLKKDIQSYAKLEEEDDQDESGWKRLHADVFRFPPNKTLFCAILGSGVQIMLVFLGMLTLAVLGVFNPYGRGTTFAAIIAFYSLTAVMAGYISGSYYKSMGGTDWVNNVLLTMTLFVMPVFVVWAFLNTVAIIYSSTAALPFGTIVALFFLYFFVTFPLTLAGAIVGKNYASEFYAPTKTKFAPREIPTVPWYRGPLFSVFAAGLLPFTSISVELFYVFISIWGHQFFAPFGILYLVFLILLLMTACIAVTATYLQLRFENHQWWWFSVGCGGSTALYVYLYSFHFLSAESQMNGFFQLSFYFGYTALLCYALFLMLGTIGFFSSLLFVRQIYKTIKSD